MCPDKQVRRARNPAQGRWWTWAALVICLGLLAGGWFFLPIERWMHVLQSWDDRLGAWSPLIFGAIYIVAVVLLLPGSLLSLSTGFLYGYWGIPLAVVAATIGASIAFLLARHAAQATVRSYMAKHKTLDAIEKAVDEQGWKIVGLVRTSPLVPFNLQNYVFGVTDIPFWHYVAATFVGIIPGTVVNVYIGMLGGWLANGKSGTSLQWGFLAIGLAASVLVAWMVTRKAKKKLSEAGIADEKQP